MPTTPQAQKLILTSAILASSMAFIDSTALNVAMPALQRSLSLSGSELLWVVNGYTLFLAALILLGGSLGDIYGKKRVFVFGIVLFTLFSALCGFAPSGEWLIISRALQGVGGAFMIPGSLSIISAAFPQKTRGTAIGTWSMFSAFTTLFGPVLGGYLASQGLWRYIFFINIPLGILSMFLLSRVKEPAATTGQKTDWLGGTLITLSLSLLTYGFIEASEQGFGEMAIISSIGLGALLLVAFVFIELRVKMPMLPMRLFQSPTFSAANALTFLVYGALGAVLFFLPLNLVQIQGYREDMAGFALLPFAGLIALLARISGRWTDKIGAKIPLVVGPVITGVAFYSFSFIGITNGPAAYWGSFFVPLLVAGVGMGLTVVPLTTAVMNCVDDKSTGVASGVNNTITRFANVMTLAVLGSFMLLTFKASFMESLASGDFDQQELTALEKQADRLAEAAAPGDWPSEKQQVVKEKVQSSFLEAYHTICRIAGICCALSALLSYFFIKTNPRTVKLE